MIQKSGIFKKIALRYSTVTNGNRSINLDDLFNEFGPIQEAKIEEKNNHPEDDIISIQLDPVHIFEKLLNHYSFIKW